MTYLSGSPVGPTIRPSDRQRLSKETLYHMEYWDRYWQANRSRRNFLSSLGIAGAGAAGLALVGCGDDDNDGGSKTQVSLATPTPGAQATATPSDPFANAKRGGTLRIALAAEPPTIDPYGNASYLTKFLSTFVYSRLYKFNAGPGVKRGDLKPVPDLVESTETSPDGLTWTMKLRDAKFHNVAPVNGRAVDTDDVKFSWGRVTDPKWSASAQWSFVDKVEYIDQKTFKFTLKAPNAAFLDNLADTQFWVMPKEADGGYSPAKQQIGTGPWVFGEYVPSQGLKYKKNPDWYYKGFPLMDEVDAAIIPNYSNRLAQFQAKKLDLCDPVGDDLVPLKSQMSDVKLIGSVPNLLNWIIFDSNPDSPWAKDPRVRLAVSMAQDRDGITDLAYNVKKLKAAGLDMQGPWSNCIPAGLDRFWLDPQGPNAGEGAKYFKYDVAEAKKLLAAAGFPNGFSAKYQYPATVYGAAFNTMAEASIQFFSAIGIKLDVEVQDYASKYITQTFKGDFTGITFGGETQFPEGGGYVNRMFTDNPLNHARVKDPTLMDLAKKQQSELDPAKRREIINEIQRYHATKMYYVPGQWGAATTFASALGNIENVGEIQTNSGSYAGSTETYIYYWRNA